jgi:hypothetical protein
MNQVIRHHCSAYKIIAHKKLKGGRDLLDGEGLLLISQSFLTEIQ